MLYMKKDKNSNLDLETVTKESILNSLSTQFQSVNEIISNIKEAKHRIDHLYVQLKLMLLEREGIVEMVSDEGKKLYRLK